MAITGRPGTQKLSKPIGVVELTGCVYNTALSFPSITVAPPARDVSTGVAAANCMGYGGAIVTFSGTDAANETFGYIAYGYMPIGSPDGVALFPLTIAAGVVTLGAKTLGAAGAFIEGTASLIADTITETTACTLSEVWSPAGDDAAALLLDVSGFHYIAVHVTRNGQTAATMNVHINLCDGWAAKNLIEPSITFGSVDLTGTAATNLGSIKTNTDPLVTGGGGGYIRQDSTGTIAKETGGNLASVKTNTDPFVTVGAGGYVRQDSNASIALETGGNLASVKTNTDPFVVAGGGGYVRQDSTGTIAKETGGHLATVKTNTDPLVTAGGGGYVRQDSTGTIAKESGGNLAAAAADLNELTAAPIEKALTVISMTVGTPGTPVALGSSAQARKVYLCATRLGANNSSEVYIGTGVVDHAAARQMIMAPGDTLVIDPGLGACVDLDAIWLDGSNTDDAVQGWYIPV